MLLVKFIIFTLLSSLCSTYKVLIIFPVPGKSHAILGKGFVRHLLDAGHEVTYITPIKLKKIHPRLRLIDVSSNHDLMQVETIFDITKIINKRYSFQNVYEKLDTFANFAYKVIMHSNIQRLFYDTSEQFDVVIAEWLFNDLYSGFSTVFDCPLIWLSSIEPHSQVLELIDEALNPAYNPHYKSDVLPPYTFFHRVQELWMALELKFHKWWLESTEERYFTNAFAASVKKRGRALPSYDEVRYNASLMFGNSHIATGSSIRLPQNYVAIGGYHIKESVESLPPHIQTILDNAKNGLIYISMGSMAKSCSIPNEMQKGLLDTFRKLNQTILWKFEEEIDDLPKNVHIVSWTPQVGVLAHPNCKLFITHGGLLSIIEAIHFGVPIIGIPLFGDQNINVNRAVRKGFGKRLNLNSEIGVQMEAAIQEIFYDDRSTAVCLKEPYLLKGTKTCYHDCMCVRVFEKIQHDSDLRDKFYRKIKEYSLIYHDQVTSPGKLLTHWVSHVVRTKGAQHLRSPALLIPWYQKLYIDLAVVIIIILYVVYKISVRAFNRNVVLDWKLYTLKQKTS